MPATLLVGTTTRTRNDTAPLHAGQYSAINVEGAAATAAYGINDSGQIVGAYVVVTGCNCENDLQLHAFCADRRRD